MLNLGIKLSSWRYKNSVRRSLTNRSDNVASRIPPNASFLDGVATKDCLIDPESSLSIRIFLPHHCLGTESSAGSPRGLGFGWLPDQQLHPQDPPLDLRSSLEILSDASSVGSSTEAEKLEEVLKFSGGYNPRRESRSNIKLPVIIQFHDGAFVSGSKDSAANDTLCRRISKACKCVVIAVGYRLAPAHRFPAARDDGVFVLRWLAKQANLAAFPAAVHAHGIIDSFGELPVDPWISAHLDFSRCVLMGVGAGGSIALQISQEIVGLKLQLEPLNVLSQVLLHPLLGGDTPLTDSSYFMDKDLLAFAWACSLPEGTNPSDHPAANPLKCSRLILARMPATLVITAELDVMRDRASALVQALKNARVEATSIVYRNAVYGFASMESSMDTKLAQACVEDIAMWFAKHVRCDYWS